MFFLPASRPDEIRLVEDVVLLPVFLDSTVDTIHGILIMLVCVKIVIAHRLWGLDRSVSTVGSRLLSVLDLDLDFL